MKPLRTVVVVAAVLVAMLSASVALAETEAEKSFHQLATLEGKWVGKGSQGQPIEVTFRMTAGGSALMSEIHGEGHEDMISMFHMDGDRLIMTHYCGAGNQPRMKAVSADGKSVSFEFFDGTNIGAGAGHMQHVTFAQPDSDHHTEAWVFLDHGSEMKQFFTLERAK
ncbi:MAG: hypothetical protein WBV46_06850 [Terriglobales bacterium]